MPELQRKGKRVGLHSTVFRKAGLQIQVLPTACTGKSLANCENQAKLRRVYSPAQTPLERLLACGQAEVRRIAGFKRLLATLDPFDLAARINRKLESVYQLGNRRLSPKAETSRRATAVEKTRRGKVQKGGLSHRSWKSRKQRGIPTLPQLDDGCYPVTSLMA